MKTSLLISLNTIVAITLAWLIVRWGKGSWLAINDSDQPYFFVAAGVSAVFGTLVLLRWILRFADKENWLVRWLGVCLLNLGVVLITHIGAGTTLALRSFWRYHQYMTTHSETYVFDWWAGPVQSSLLFIGFSLYIFSAITIPASLIIAMVWLFFYRRHP